MVKLTNMVKLVYLSHVVQYMLQLSAADYVCVMDVGMFEISLRTTNTPTSVSLELFYDYADLVIQLLYASDLV